MKKLSIVITRYAEDLGMLLRLLDSVSRQTFKDLEVIVSDDGHDAPGISQVIDSYEFPIRHVTSDKLSVSHARNVGFRMCNSKYLMFCDCDDMFFDEHPDGLERAICKMDANSLQMLRSIIMFEMPKKSSGGLSAIQPLGDNDELVTVQSARVNGSAVHGKIFDLQFARSADAEFCDDLSLNEESPFVSYLHGISERSYDMAYPFYVWKYNAKSVTRTADLYPINGLNSYAKATRIQFEKILAYDRANSTHYFDCKGPTASLVQQFYWLEHMKPGFCKHPNFKLYYAADVTEVSKLAHAFRRYVDLTFAADYVRQYMNSNNEIPDVTAFMAEFETWLDGISR